MTGSDAGEDGAAEEDEDGGSDDLYGWALSGAETGDEGEKDAVGLGEEGGDGGVGVGEAPGLDAHAEAAPEGEEEALSDFGASGSREAGDEGEEDEGGEAEAGHLDPGGEEDAGGLGEAGLLFELEDLDDGEAKAPEGTGEDEEEDGHACGGGWLLVIWYWGGAGDGEE